MQQDVAPTQIDAESSEGEPAPRLRSRSRSAHASRMDQEPHLVTLPLARPAQRPRAICRPRPPWGYSRDAEAYAQLEREEDRRTGRLYAWHRDEEARLEQIERLQYAGFNHWRWTYDHWTSPGQWARTMHSSHSTLSLGETFARDESAARLLEQEQEDRDFHLRMFDLIHEDGCSCRWCDL